jgi:hypothetical protein
MKIACATIVGILAFLISGCVTGDEITSYIIETDDSIAFSIYRQDLTSDQAGEEGEKELAEYIKGLENRSDSLFADFAKANAQEVKISILRSASPASILITGWIPSLDNFAAYFSHEAEDSSLVCTSFTRERTRGFLFELIRKHPETGRQPADDNRSAGSLDETRVALAEGRFTRAQGFLLAHDGRSALLDKDALDRQLDSAAPSITLSLEWQTPDSP